MNQSLLMNIMGALLGGDGGSSSDDDEMDNDYFDMESDEDDDSSDDNEDDGAIDFNKVVEAKPLVEELRQRFEADLARLAQRRNLLSNSKMLASLQDHALPVLGSSASAELLSAKYRSLDMLSPELLQLLVENTQTALLRSPQHAHLLITPTTTKVQLVRPKEKVSWTKQHLAQICTAILQNCASSLTILQVRIKDDANETLRSMFEGAGDAFGGSRPGLSREQREGLSSRLEALKGGGPRALMQALCGNSSGSGNCPGLSEEQVRSLVAKLKNLQELELDEASDRLFKDIAKFLPGLKKLYVSDTRAVGPNGLKALVGGCKQLLDLNLGHKFSKQITARDLEMVLTHLPGLEHLVHPLTCLAMARVAETRGPELPPLNLTGTIYLQGKGQGKINPASVGKIFTTFPRLTGVELDRPTLTQLRNLAKVSAPLTTLDLTLTGSGKAADQTLAKIITRFAPTLRTLLIINGESLGSTHAIRINVELVGRLCQELKELELEGILYSGSPLQPGVRYFQHLTKCHLTQKDEITATCRLPDPLMVELLSSEHLSDINFTEVLLAPSVIHTLMDKARQDEKVFSHLEKYEFYLMGVRAAERVGIACFAPRLENVRTEEIRKESVDDAVFAQFMEQFLPHVEHLQTYG